jgi:hypothetical protein
MSQIEIGAEDEARIAALLQRLPIATRPSLVAHALSLGLAALERDPLAKEAAASDDGDGDALAAAARAYARARKAANGRALKIAQAREAFDHAVDDFLEQVR